MVCPACHWYTATFSCPLCLCWCCRKTIFYIIGLPFEYTCNCYNNCYRWKQDSSVHSWSQRKVMWRPAERGVMEDWGSVTRPIRLFRKSWHFQKIAASRQCPHPKVLMDIRWHYLRLERCSVGEMVRYVPFSLVCKFLGLKITPTGYVIVQMGSHVEPRSSANLLDSLLTWKKYGLRDSRCVLYMHVNNF